MSREQTSRTRMIVIALGTVIAIGVPFAAAEAQSGDALAKAELACIDQGVRPYTPSFETCVNRVVLSFDRGAIETGYRQASVLRRAREVCTSYGIPPDTLNYRECINVETDRHLAKSPVTYRTLYFAN